MNNHSATAPEGRLWRDADDREYYRIDGIDQMDPFLMTIVSSADLWMFVSSNGSLTAGRVDADRAVFPYQTVDRLHVANGVSGPITMIRRSDDAGELWEPFGRRRTPGCVRSVAKTVIGDRLVFEENHPGWGLLYRVTWAPANTHGWVRTIELIDEGGADTAYEVLDGFLDVMPAGIDAHTEMTLSNLADAYKRTELGAGGRLAFFTLESLVSDRAEPAEALAAAVVWSAGFDQAEVHLDPHVVDDMFHRRATTPTRLLTGRPGAYLLRGTVTVKAGSSESWLLLLDTDLDHAQVVDVVEFTNRPDAVDRISSDIESGSQHLAELVNSADAAQRTGDPIADAHHLSNVLFNSMRGGVFPFEHAVPIDDLRAFVESRNRPAASRHRQWFDGFDAMVGVDELRMQAAATGDHQLERLVLEYLPLTFSRRHGDPSRPWNRFSIRVRNDLGQPLLSYEGNWRDIFQNWEALLHSYPRYLPHVVAKFVNASTLDGFNPYRISREGIDWEVPEPENPWSHIGYWGDHQIVYLTRLLEVWGNHEPGAVEQWLDQPLFSYANVPYRLADHESMVADPRHTIAFDTDRAQAIAEREAAIGTDARLVLDSDGEVLLVGFAEKLLVPALAKMSSFVSGGGIWLNTQRPEWNDANNALAGPGLSMVTLFHLQRYLSLVDELVERAGLTTVPITESVRTWMNELTDVFDAHPVGPVDDRRRRQLLDELGRSGEAHRARIEGGSELGIAACSIADIRRFIEVASAHLDATGRSARRPDGLVHSYNRVSFPDEHTAEIDHLGPMLEGQVAALSSGQLGTAASVELVDALFASEMYRPDQNTFMLYPAPPLPSFLDRNRLSPETAAQVRALALSSSELAQLFVVDGNDELHFRREFTNAAVLEAELSDIGVEADARRTLLDVYEEVFDHGAFTGRSGRMYGYEGLGSVYWHMVAKLLLAIQEVCFDAVDRDEPPELQRAAIEAYRRVRNGLGFVKDPTTYGAIPTDCYSHTPAHGGAKQPGMTGQVKEEILTRLGELGVRVVAGRITLQPGLLESADVFPRGAAGDAEPARFHLCTVPVTIASGERDQTVVRRADGTDAAEPGLGLSASDSADVFARNGAVTAIEWTLGSATLKPW